MLAVLHEPRFCDLSPAEVYATLLDEKRYLRSERTMYRILDDNCEVRERRAQLRHPAYTAPQLLATRPNQVWSWDITKLLGPQTANHQMESDQWSELHPLDSVDPPVRFSAQMSKVCDVQRSRMAWVVLLVCTLASSQAYAGAWTRGGSGRFALQLGMNYYAASQQFDGSGNTAPIQVFQYIEGTPFAAQVDSAYRSVEFTLYAEIGLLKNLDFILYIPYWKMISQSYPDNPDFTAGGVGDGVAWLKANFLNHRHLVMSLRGGVDLPFGDPNKSVAYPAPFEDKRLPIPLGDREVAGELSLIASHSFYPVPIYLSGDFGARFRGSHKYGDTTVIFSDELLFLVEFGYSLFFKKVVTSWLPKIDFMLNLRGNFSLGNGEIIGPPPVGYSYNLYLPNNASALQLGPQVSINLFKNFFLSARYERVLWGKNTGVGNIVGVTLGAYR